MSRKSISLAYIFLTLALILGACTSISPTSPLSPVDSPEPIRIVDGLGREIELESPATRVVSLAPSNTEILFAIGAGELVLGRDEFSDYPPEAADLPSIGGSFSQYNNEAIVALNPDLVLAAEINTPEQVQTLEDLGLTVFYLANPSTMDELFANLVTVAKLTGYDAQAAELVADLASRVANVLDAVNQVEGRPKVFYELDSTDPSAPWTAGSGTFIDTLIGMAGGENIARDLQGDYLQISIEELIVRDPEIILLGDAAYGVTPESVAARTGWGAIEAVKSGQVYPFDDNLASRPGPRLVEGLETLARLIHPDIFN